MKIHLHVSFNRVIGGCVEVDLKELQWWILLQIHVVFVDQSQLQHIPRIFFVHENNVFGKAVLVLGVFLLNSTEMPFIIIS